MLIQEVSHEDALNLLATRVSAESRVRKGINRMWSHSISPITTATSAAFQPLVKRSDGCAPIRWSASKSMRS